VIEKELVNFLWKSRANRIGFLHGFADYNEVLKRFDGRSVLPTC